MSAPPGRLWGRIRGMGHTGQHQRAQATQSAPGGPQGPPATSATYASGASSPGAQNSAPYGAPQGGGLQPVDQSHPAVAKPNGGGMATPPAVQVMPLQAVVVGPTTGTDYVTLGMQEMTPIFTTDGAAIPATAPGRWQQVKAAGRP